MTSRNRPTTLKVVRVGWIPPETFAPCPSCSTSADGYKTQIDSQAVETESSSTSKTYVAFRAARVSLTDKSYEFHATEWQTNPLQPRGAVLTKFLLCPPNFVVLQKNCFKHVIRKSFPFN